MKEFSRDYGNEIFTANKCNKTSSVSSVLNKTPICLHMNHQKLMYQSLYHSLMAIETVSETSELSFILIRIDTAFYP